MSLTRSRRVLPATLLLVLSVSLSARAALPKVPEGFEVRLVATVPAVLYPCQVATAPDGSLFVAEDPMDQVGPVRGQHGRILLFREGKEPVVFADGFRAIFGMAWRDGALYVLHMPFLTVLRDTDGDGKADERKDLFKDLGVRPANRGLNDHIVSGLQFGMDGYLYISVGDKGIPKATGPDGRTIQIIGGGICRCRPDGTGLEVFSTGTRNHLEPNLDDRDNLFTYDNTDDGLGWWTRVTHHVDGGYYGYPYDYHDRHRPHAPPDGRVRRRLPCGAVVLQGRRLAREVPRRRLLGRVGQGEGPRVPVRPRWLDVQGRPRRSTSPCPAGSSNFRPIDLAVSYDGRTLYVADWNMGGWGARPRRSAAIFAITWKGEVKTRPRGQRLRPDRRADPAARPPLVQRADAGAGGADQAGPRRARRRRPPRWPTPRPTRSPDGTWSGCSTASPGARPRRPAADRRA